MTRALTFAAITVALSSGVTPAQSSGDTRIELSYERQVSSMWFANLQEPPTCNASLTIKIRAPHFVDLDCGYSSIAGPRGSTYDISDADFAALVKAFDETSFFPMPPTGQVAADAGYQKLRYADGSRIHEVEDYGPASVQLRSLEQRFVELAGIEPFVHPSAAGYQHLIASRWNPNSNALLATANAYDAASYRLLLSHGAGLSLQILDLVSARVDAQKFLASAVTIDPSSEEGKRVLAQSTAAADIAVATMDALGPHAGSDIAKSLLLEAAMQNDMAAARALLDRGADPNGSPGAVQTPLPSGVIADSDELIALFISRGADPSPALGSAASADRIDKLALLLRLGAKVNAQSGAFHGTALMAAASRCSASAVKALLDAGADPRLTDAAGHGGLELVASTKPDAASSPDCIVTRKLLETAIKK